MIVPAELRHVSIAQKNDSKYIAFTTQFFYVTRYMFTDLPQICNLYSGG